ncbi:MAG: LacI family DNA-binding transcriptional regulator [Lachnospiraceae bacterium]|nr:LacI family DNA-binding transcriptional regulator [Lachnospiraceae bacterium]
MAITIRDVAKKAGVSVSTVSKVINGWTSISAETTARVNAVIEELHFTPNARAVSFARRATKNIVFLTSLEREEAYKNPHMFDIMCGVYSELAGYNYTVTLVDTSEEAYPGETVEHMIAGGAADGVVVHGSALNENTAQKIIEKNFPHTIIGNPGLDTQLCWIDTDHVQAGQFAAEHLIACGYTKAAFIGGKKTDAISQQRLKGVRQTMLKSGHRMEQAHIRYTGSSRQEGYTAATDLLSGENRPEAIVCENNTIALGVSKAIEHLSLKVPEEIAFLTFNRYPYSNVIDPAPTIVDIDMYDMGKQAGITMARKLQTPSLLVQSFTTLPILVQGETTRKKASDSSLDH